MPHKIIMRFISDPEPANNLRGFNQRYMPLTIKIFPKTKKAMDDDLGTITLKGSSYYHGFDNSIKHLSLSITMVSDTIKSIRFQENFYNEYFF